MQPPSSNSEGPGGESNAALRGLEGTLIGGRYHVLRRIGAGGMGVVYEAEQRPLRRRVALKLLRSSVSGGFSAEMVQRFLREAEAMARVNHPRLAVVYDVGAADGTMFLAMELAEGKTLRDVLRGRREPLPLEQVRTIGVQLAEGLAAIHAEQLVHRDLKPGNVMVAGLEVGAPEVKILDLGLVKMLQEEKALTQKEMVLGSPRYMAPEQVLGEPVDARTDIYALGGLLYHLAAGRPAFDQSTRYDAMRAQVSEPAPPLVQTSPQLIPRAFAEVVHQCLEKSPAARPQSAAEVATRLAESGLSSRPTVRASDRPAPAASGSANTLLHLPEFQGSAGAAPAALPRGTFRAEPEPALSANAAPPGALAAPGSAAPGSAAPGSAAPGSAAPGSAAPGSDAPGSAAPGSAYGAGGAAPAASAPPAAIATASSSANSSAPGWGAGAPPSPFANAGANPAAGAAWGAPEVETSATLTLPQRRVKPLLVFFVLFLVGMGGGAAAIAWNRTNAAEAPAELQAGGAAPEPTPAADPPAPAAALTLFTLTSSPSPARVTGPEGDLGDTPLQLPLHLGEQLRVEVEAEGHERREVLLIGGIEGVHISLHAEDAHEEGRPRSSRGGAHRARAEMVATATEPSAPPPTTDRPARRTEIHDPWGE